MKVTRTKRQTERDKIRDLCFFIDKKKYKLRGTKIRTVIRGQAWFMLTAYTKSNSFFSSEKKIFKFYCSNDTKTLYMIRFDKDQIEDNFIEKVIKDITKTKMFKKLEWRTNDVYD